MPPNYNADVRLALAAGEPAPTITAEQHAAVLRAVATMAPWAGALDAEQVAAGEPVRGHVVRVTPIEQGAAVKAHPDGGLTVTAPDGTVTHGRRGRGVVAPSPAVRAALAARSGAGLAWFQNPPVPGQPCAPPPLMAELGAGVFDTYPEKHIIRCQAVDGEPAPAYWACIPCPPFWARPGCSHCQAAPPQALRPPRPLCAYHEHYARTGQCLSFAEQVFLEQPPPGPAAGWTAAQRACFVNLWRRRLASARLLAGSEPLPPLTAVESRSVGLLLGPVGRPAAGGAPADGDEEDCDEGCHPM